VAVTLEEAGGGGGPLTVAAHDGVNMPQAGGHRCQSAELDMGDTGDVAIGVLAFLADVEQLAASSRTAEEMRDLIGATSLYHLSLEGMQAATRLPEQSVCRACFTRSYPTRVPLEQNVAKLRFERV